MRSPGAGDGRLGRTALLLVLLPVAAAVAWAGWRAGAARRSAPVAIADNSQALFELLERRARTASSDRTAAEPDALAREPLDPETVALFFAMFDGRSYVYDRRAYFKPRSGTSYRVDRFPEHPEGGWEVRFNRLGARRSGEVRRPKPDLRIVVTGDSHTAGVVPEDETLAARVEDLLSADISGGSVEALNFGVGGYNPYNYLGVLEATRAALEYDVFVVVVYGGNDFSGVVPLSWYFHRRHPRGAGLYPPERSIALARGHPREFAQELLQAVFFLEYPDEVRTAVEAVTAVSAEIADLCRAGDVRPLFVYLPPPSVQPGCRRRAREAALATLEAPPGALRISDRIADRWLAFLEARSIPHLDLRHRFAAAAECLYWRSDWHLNTAGHRVAAEELAAVLRQPE